MTEDKLYELVEKEYLKVPDDILEYNRRACRGMEEAGWKFTTTQYESSIIKEIVKIILTNFTLTDKNARH